jgi:hypothetical protein
LRAALLGRLLGPPLRALEGALREHDREHLPAGADERLRDRRRILLLEQLDLALALVHDRGPAEVQLLRGAAELLHEPRLLLGVRGRLEVPDPGDELLTLLSRPNSRVQSGSSCQPTNTSSKEPCPCIASLARWWNQFMPFAVDSRKMLVPGRLARPAAATKL